MNFSFIPRLFVCLLLYATAQAHALTAEQALAMAAGDADDRVAAVQQAVVDPSERTAAFLQALADDAVKVAGGKALIVRDDKGIDPVTGAEVPLPADAEDIINNNRMRGEIDTALAGLALFGKDEAQRMAAAKALTKEPDGGRLPLLDKALAQETSDKIKAQLQLARAATLLGSDDASQRIAAAQALSASATPDTRLLLNERVAVEEDAKVKAALQAALRTLDDQLAWGERLGAAFSGISLGSILLLVALGLAITYGLMGVINMAHGELMMIGAYATYVVQGVFQKFFPSAFDWYLVAAVPLAFLTSALVGAVLERGVLRFLYGRPLETLLATWGISLVLMQLVRSLFGAQNVGVENPAWMSGGVQVLSNLTLPYNRLVIIGFAIAVLMGMGYLIGRTRLGLFVRGVTQNRPIASCMGVNTARIDTMAFALGSGIAGLAGCALSQVGNVGPDLGQSYIVDAFMVVVLGGVGQLAGTVYAALGLGILNKFLEGWAGAVLAKIAVLVFIIIFIQKRPQGIFAVKGRTAD
ncbi:urea transport system permease protein [Acidovorax delafieldii]|uniref:Urea transport system permease protein n=1 Tax=Acidovorax delafieldii TaxID=47920 RepID=A0AAJ2BQ96_ACIDE|nr:urea ABC transporter permease subunit UrtB [Acidovorax delafieldii]MDR6766447.1 urea transport system permease protein [Acidovorax delafieldii]MDR6836615.1 urea transport system permease protein [Acidovorax delafieldii]MDR7366106.1 urea transport system permease protein [Acidovorax delafieldii]